MKKFGFLADFGLTRLVPGHRPHDVHMVTDQHISLHSLTLQSHDNHMTHLPRVFTSGAVATETEIIEGGVSMESKEQEISGRTPAGSLAASI